MQLMSNFLLVSYLDLVDLELVFRVTTTMKSCISGFINAVCAIVCKF